MARKMETAGFGRGRRLPNGRNVLPRGNGHKSIEGTSGNSGRKGLSSTSRLHFDRRLFSKHRGEGAPGNNVTQYEQVDMSFIQTGGGSKSHGEKFAENDIEKRQRVLEEAFGSLQGIVNGLGVDFGCLKSEVDSIRTGIGSLARDKYD